MTVAQSPLRLAYSIPLAALSGCLYFTGFAGFDQWYLMFFSLVPLLASIEAASPVRSMLLGWLMGTVTNLGGYYWVVGMLDRFSGFPMPLCILFTVLLCAYQGGTFAVFALGVSLLRKRGWDPFFSGAAVLVLMERLYPLLFPSFMGNAMYVHPVLVQTADIGGVSMISFLLASANFALAGIVRLSRFGRQAWRPVHVIVAAGLWAAALAYGLARIHMLDGMVKTGDHATVGIVQVNMGTFEKWDDPMEGLRRHRADSLALAEKHDLDLLVWPESAVVYALPTSMTNLKLRVLGKVSVPTVFGAVRTEPAPDGEKIYNTAYIVDADGQRKGFYDKVYLLAFGEYLPLGETFPILYEWSPNSSQFNRGTVRRPLPFGKHSLATLICYEDILPRYVNSIMRAEDPSPGILVNITNDSWFGDTTEPRIHLALASFRAVEQRRWLVRATNSGISAFVDPVGRITKTVPAMERGAIVEEVSFNTGRTIYSRMGWTFDWACIAACVAMMCVGPHRQAKVHVKRKGKKGKKKG